MWLKTQIFSKWGLLRQNQGDKCVWKQIDCQGETRAKGVCDFSIICVGSMMSCLKIICSIWRSILSGICPLRRHSEEHPHQTPISSYIRLTPWTHTHRNAPCASWAFLISKDGGEDHSSVFVGLGTGHTLLLHSDQRQTHGAAEISPSDQQFHHFEGW